MLPPPSTTPKEPEKMSKKSEYRGYEPSPYDSQSESEEEKEKEEPSPPLHSSKNSDGITVDELIAYLQELKKNHKNIGDYLVYHVEFGGLTKSSQVEMDMKREILVVE